MMSRDAKLDRILKTDQFNCTRCTILVQCASCQALERAFNAAPVGRDWLAWARDQRVEPEPKRLLVGLANRVSEHGFVHDSLAHYATDAGLPKYDGDIEARDRIDSHERELGSWAWRHMRELIRAGLVEVDLTDPTVPTQVVWVRLRDPHWPRVWRECVAA